MSDAPKTVSCSFRDIAGILDTIFTLRKAKRSLNVRISENYAGGVEGGGGWGC